MNFEYWILLIIGAGNALMVTMAVGVVMDKQKKSKSLAAGSIVALKEAAKRNADTLISLRDVLDSHDVTKPVAHDPVKAVKAIQCAYLNLNSDYQQLQREKDDLATDFALALRRHAAENIERQSELERLRNELEPRIPAAKFFSLSECVDAISMLARDFRTVLQTVAPNAMVAVEQTVVWMLGRRPR